MTQRSTAVHIPTPCPEPWATMTATSNGRHCAVCQTEVVDFTQKSPAEILAYLRQETGKRVCGRLSTTQLAVATAAPSPHNRWRKWVGAVLTVGSLSAILLPKAAARGPLTLASLPAEPVCATPFQEAPVLIKRLQKRLSASTIVVRGVVLDARSHTPAVEVTIMLKGTNWGTSTNASGEFSLTVPARGRHIELVAAFIGYKTLVKKLAIKASDQPVTILLEQDTTMLGLINAPDTPASSFLARLQGFHWFS